MPLFAEALKDFGLVFLPLFVAMDPLPLIPFLIGLTGRLPAQRRGYVVRLSLVTGLVVGLLFLGLGRGIFYVLGIAVSDFLVAGGVVLLALALKDLLTTREETPAEPQELTAVVPIGTPLLVGPATISLLIVLSGLYPLWLVVLAFLANIVTAWAIFSQAQRIVRFLGKGGCKPSPRLCTCCWRP